VSAVDRVDVDTERNLLDILDRVHEIHLEAVDPTHVFTLSQAHEGLLLKMGERNNDGGQFFTPREVIRSMVRVVDPKVGGAVIIQRGHANDVTGRLAPARRPAPALRMNRCVTRKHKLRAAPRKHKLPVTSNLWYAAQGGERPRPGKRWWRWGRVELPVRNP
jgi:hypothetical protein